MSVALLGPSLAQTEHCAQSMLAESIHIVLSSIPAAVEASLWLFSAG